jgi:hypothetical protein
MAMLYSDYGTVISVAGSADAADLKISELRLRCSSAIESKYPAHDRENSLRGISTAPLAEYVDAHIEACIAVYHTQKALIEAARDAEDTEENRVAAINALNLAAVVWPV